MNKQNHTLISHHPRKNIGIILPVVFLLFTLTISSLYALQISFFVPEDHEKYDLIDSLYSRMDSLDCAFTKIENNVIRDKTIRSEELVVKEQYLKHQLKYNLATKEHVLEYCTAFKIFMEARMNYFNELLSTLKGDIRSKCFILWKNSRTELAQITEILQKFDTQESEVHKITYRKKEPESESPSLKEPTLKDILGEELMSEDDYENPFEQSKTIMTKPERDE